MKKTWMEVMRRKLEGHRKPPPDGLWEGISEQMGLKTETTSHPASHRRWYWAAAAILVLGGFFAFYHHYDSNEPSSMTATNVLQSEETKQMKETEEMPKQSALELQKVVAEAKPLLKEKTVNKSQATFEETVKEHHETAVKEHHETTEKEHHETAMKEHDETAVKEHDETAVKEAEILADAQTSEPKAEADEEKPIPPVAYNQQKETAATIEPVPSGFVDHSASHPSNKDKWSMGLQASGGLLAANNTMGSTRYDPMVKANYMYNDVLLAESSSYKLPYNSIENETCDSKHHPPVRIGMSMQYQLNDRLALLTGVNYAWLYSEFTQNDSKTDQHLHYFGIPVGLSYLLWSNQHLQCYISGTAMLEKCLNEKPWQWSVDAGAGAEYAITQRLGLYLEPSLGYYFDDGTSFEHYYKDHPLAPSIMFGLRMHVK